MLTWLVRFPPIVYTDEGEKIAERLWRETLEEGRALGVDKALEGLGIRD